MLVTVVLYFALLYLVASLTSAGPVFYYSGAEKPNS